MADLREADLTEADLSGANLQDASLTGAICEGTKLQDGKNINLDLIGKAKSLRQAILDSEIQDQISKTYPHLLV